MNPQNSQQALQQIQQQQSKALSPQQYLAQQESNLGVAGQKEAVTGLRGAIANTTKLLGQVAPSVSGRSANSLVNAAAQQRIIANEQAPISSTLETQGRDYTTAAADLNELQSRAAQLANAGYQAQQDKMSYMQNLYNTFYAREEAEKARQQAERDRQEQIRQFNEQLAAQQRAEAASRASSGAGGYNVGSQPQTKEKNYIGNNDLRGRLSYMAQQGNQNAKIALQYVGNDGKYYINFDKPPNYVTDWNKVKKALNAIGAVNAYTGRGSK
jgi:hypothetical protein